MVRSSQPLTMRCYADEEYVPIRQRGRAGRRGGPAERASRKRNEDWHDTAAEEEVQMQGPECKWGCWVIGYRKISAGLLVEGVLREWEQIVGDMQWANEGTETTRKGRSG